MPKIYSPEEKENIRKALRREAGKCLALYGVRKTTVDELVKRVDIPKGTFYLFYDSKEALFFDLLSSFADEVETEYLSMLQEIDENHIVTSLTDIFYALLSRFYDEEDYTKPTAFLIGNEGNGLPEEICAEAEHKIKIPMHGQVESLNAAMAAGILMYEVCRQRRK